MVSCQDLAFLEIRIKSLKMFNPDHLPVYPSVSITMPTYVTYMHKRTERMNELIFVSKKIIYCEFNPFRIGLKLIISINKS